MFWPSYFILAYVTLGLQIGLKSHLMLGSAWPNLVLLAAIFIAMNAPRDAALLGAFGLGALQDLVTQQTFGLYSFSYGLTAMLVVSSQQVVYRGHPLTHFFLALFGGTVCAVVILVHGLFRQPRDPASALFGSAVYTAFAAIVVLGILNRFKRVFAFQPGKRKLRY
jgi:rod shape-determining protein MreD